MVSRLRGKRAFDIIVGSAMIAFLLPILLFCVIGILLTEGRPVFYKSVRRVYASRSLRVAKFRTMRRNADLLLNRDTVPIGTVCFLNISPDSPAYTPIGRIIERFMLTELPQLFHVIYGDMSVVGNRPLPENVIDALRVHHPSVEQRFLVPSGLTGPAQLVGREAISDADRLRVEIAYCQSVLRAYSVLLDLKILFYTIMIGFSPRFRFSPDQVMALLEPQTGRQRSGVFQNRFARWLP